MKNIFNLRPFIVFLGRNKLYTFITVFGFAVALMFTVLVSLYARDEFSKDNFHTNGHRVWTYHTEGGKCYVPPPIGNDLVGRFPQIEKAALIANWGTTIQDRNGEKMGASCLLTDSTLFSILTFDFIEGEASTALLSDDMIVLSENFALKTFPGESALGKTLIVPKFNPDGSDRTLTVGGVIRNIKNSVIPNLDIIARIGIRKSMWIGFVQGYDAGNYNLLLLAAEGTNLNDYSQEVTDFLTNDIKYWTFIKGFAKQANFTPLRDIYFSDLTTCMNTGDKTFVLVLILTALAILFFAVINYINLSVAQSSFRAREMATRRLLGAGVGEIFGRFIVESTVLCLIAFLLGLSMAQMAEPVFNDMVEADVRISSEFTTLNIGMSAGLVLLLGVISGLVPAFVITRFKAVEVVKGAFTYRTKKIYSRVLITFQYLITVVLIGTTVLISQQVNYLRHKELGFNIKGMYVIPTGTSPENMQSVRSRLMEIPGVERVGFSSGIPTTWGNNNSFVYNDVQQSFTIFECDSTCFDMLGFKVLKHNGNNKPMWINEKGLAELGFTEVPDKVASENFGYEIGGLIGDFHFRGITGAISSAMVSDRILGWPNEIVLELTSEQAIDQIKTTMAEITGGSPFYGEWMEDQVMRWSEETRRQGELVGALAIIAVIISALGMLAMATYFIRQRTLEIAVRKVHGATRSEILGKLMWSFLSMVLVAYVLALPMLWYIARNWLDTFAYRIDINEIMFIIPALIALAVASSTVLWQAYRAMRIPAALTLKK